jgi:hypothetical protein
MAERRARGEEFAGRVNRAVELLALGSRPAAVRSVLEQEYSLSTRQALRYVRAAQATPEGVAVPEPTATFTVRLPVSPPTAAAQAAQAAQAAPIPRPPRQHQRNPCPIAGDPTLNPDRPQAARSAP